MSARRSCAIGIDIGGTKIAAGLVDETGQVCAKIVVPTPASGREEIIAELHALVAGLQAQASKLGLASPFGVGVGTAGQIDVRQGRVLSGTTNIRDWNDVPLRDILTTSSGLPVWVDNDVNVVAVGEWRFGVARGHTDFVCLTLGTGVGGGVMTGGVLLHGAWGGAAEIGHMSVDMHGPLCTCGHRGCLEAYASGTGLALRMREALARLPEDASGMASLDTYRSDPATVTSEAVFRWMREGDPVAFKVVETMLTALAIGIVNVIHMFNPTLVVLGGGLIDHEPWICEEVAARLRGLGIRSLVDPVAIRPASLGPDAGLIGAASQCWNHL